MDKATIPYLPATELSGLIKKKEISPVEAVDAYLERIEHINPKLNAFLTVCHDEARQAAREAEQALARGKYRGAMHGIPVAVKDQIYTKGIRTTGGSPIFTDFVPKEDATVISKLKNSGAILLGKLNLTEFATAFTHRFSTPRNPWNQEHYTGGSSSGSAAAAAGFLCATALGEDTGGSARYPAAWCGLVGLRPSWGRVSRWGVMPASWSMDTIGPMSRTVEDCAMTLQAIAGYDPKDPYTWDVPVPDYRKALRGDIKGLKVGIIKDLLYSDVVETEVREAIVNATSVMQDLGASVEEVSIPLASPAQIIFIECLRVEAATNYDELVRHRLHDMGHDNRITYLVGSILPAQAYYKAQKLRALLRQQVLETLERVDVLVLPTAGIPATKLEPAPVIDYTQKISHPVWRMAPAFSLASTTALNVCCGFTSQNLPIGLQIGGRPFEEETILKLAHAYEQSTPWHTKKPPI